MSYSDDIKELRTDVRSLDDKVGHIKDDVLIIKTEHQSSAKWIKILLIAIALFSGSPHAGKVIEFMQPGVAAASELEETPKHTE